MWRAWTKKKTHIQLGIVHTNTAAQICTHRKNWYKSTKMDWNGLSLTFSLCLDVFVFFCFFSSLFVFKSTPLHLLYFFLFCYTFYVSISVAYFSDYGYALLSLFVFFCEHILLVLASRCSSICYSAMCVRFVVVLPFVFRICSFHLLFCLCLSSLINIVGLLVVQFDCYFCCWLFL